MVEMAGGEIGEQAVKVTFSTTELTVDTLKSILELLMKNRNTSHIEHGKQKLNKLNQQNKKLEKVDLNKEDIKSFKRELNKHHVDFSIIKEKKSKLYSIYFKSQDIDRVHTGLKNCIKNYNEKAKQPIKETMKQAKKKPTNEKPLKKRKMQKGEKVKDESEQKTSTHIHYYRLINSILFIQPYSLSF